MAHQTMQLAPVFSFSALQRRYADTKVVALKFGSGGPPGDPEVALLLARLTATLDRLDAERPHEDAAPESNTVGLMANTKIGQFKALQLHPGYWTLVYSPRRLNNQYMVMHYAHNGALVPGAMHYGSKGYHRLVEDLTARNLAIDLLNRTLRLAAQKCDEKLVLLMATDIEKAAMRHTSHLMLPEGDRA